MRGWLATGVAALLLALPMGAQAQKPETTKVRLAVGGKSSLYYLPLTVTERLGYFKEAGLDVEISDFAGGAKSLQALIGGSADVVTGSFDHTIQMQAKNQAITAVVQMGRFPGFALALRKAKAGNYSGPKDLKGMKIGVTAPGSSTHFMVLYMMAQAGLKPDDAVFIGTGSGGTVVAAVQHGEVDGISNADPMVTKLDKEGLIRIVADTRKHIRVWPRCGTIVAQELRPVGEALEDGMLGLDEGRRDPLRRFNAIVIRKQFDGQHVFYGTAFVTALGLDALKGEIAADHQEAAAVVHEVTNELEPVGPALGSDRHPVGKQKRVCAYVAQDDNVERLDLFPREWKRIHRNVARLVGQFGAARAKGGDHFGPTLVVGGHVEGIETLGVDAVRHPGFAGEEHPYWIWHWLRSLKAFLRQLTRRRPQCRHFGEFWLNV